MCWNAGSEFTWGSERFGLVRIGPDWSGLAREQTDFNAILRRQGYGGQGTRGALREAGGVKQVRIGQMGGDAQALVVSSGDHRRQPASSSDIGKLSFRLG